MVSALWNASSTGNVENVLEILNEASGIDIEIKDQSGVTPLIEAIKNGHVEVVRVLIERGADPRNGPSQTNFEQYSSDPAILDLLRQHQSKMVNGGEPHEHTFGQEPNREGEKHFYPPPPAPYHYYPGVHPNGMPMHDGAIAYYPPPPPQPPQPQNGENISPGGTQNLPPPEIARLIPCRYFPACRYGASCIFLHPQGPFFQGPLPPPAQYPPYEPMAPQPYAPNFYPVPPPSFQPPNGIHHMSPVSPQHPSPHPSLHVRSNSEIVTPQGPFNPPPPIPPNGNHFPMTPVSPVYNHPGHGPVPPPVHHQPPPQAGPMPPQNMYNGSPPAPFPVPHEMNGQYPPPPPPNGAYQEVNGVKSPPPIQTDGFNHTNGNREGMGHYRRGSMRRSSFGGGKKPPCLFFPAGRCKNGDGCRFPHVMPDGPVNSQPHFAGRGGFRSRPHVNSNNMGRLEPKMAGVTVQDEPSPQTSRSQSSDGTRPRYPLGPKPNGINGNHVNNSKKPPIKQRVPNADEFPVLSGAVTPPARSPGSNGSLVNGNGHNGPTAAQVLQAPAPTRKDSRENILGGSSDSKPNKENHDLNGNVLEGAHEASLTKRQFAFGAVTNGVTDIGKEVSVTA